MFGPARPARQSLPFGPLGVTPAAVPPGLGSGEGSIAAAVAPDKLSHRPQGFEPRRGGSACASRPTALPPSKPPSIGEGDLWGSACATCAITLGR